MRDSLTSDAPAPDTNNAKLILAGEAMRFTRYMLDQTKVVTSKSSLRDICVREMKAIRLELGKDMKEVPAAMPKKCREILWEA